MTSSHTVVLVLSLLSCLTTAAGVALALRLRDNARAIAAGMGFSAGIMVLISLIELLPAASASIGPNAALISAALGAALLWTAHLAIPHFHLFPENGLGNRAIVRSAYLVAIGLMLHDLPEGFAMANAYMAAPQLGVLVALAIALHNLPEEFAMAAPAMLVRSRRVLFGTALLSALAEPLGAILGLIAVGIAPALNAHFMAFAAGAMLFVSVHELVPMARHYRHFSLFVAGVLASTLVYWLLERLVAAAAIGHTP